MKETRFSGLRVLVVEDESLVAMLIEDTLASIGCIVAGVAGRLEEAARQISSLEFDLAILDVNLNGRQSYPLAEALSKKGIPFFFATGYGVVGLPEMFRSIPILEKPFQQDDFERTLAKAMVSKDFLRLAADSENSRPRPQ